MRWASLAPRDRRAVVLGGAVLGLAVLVRGAALPYAHAVRDAREAVAREERLLAGERRVLREASAYPRRFEAVSREFLRGVPKLLDGGTPASVQAELARRLERTAADAPALVTRLEPLPPSAAPGGYVAIPLRVEGESDLEGFLAIVSALEAGPTLYRLEELTLDARGDREGPGPAASEPPEVLAFRFTVTGYALDPAPLRGTPTPTGARGR